MYSPFIGLIENLEKEVDALDVGYAEANIFMYSKNNLRNISCFG